MSINGSPRKCPGNADGVKFLGYWCVALGSFRGFELMFQGVVADIAWVALQPRLDNNVVSWVIEDSGIENYFDTTLVTPGCKTPSIVVLIPKSVNGLMKLYGRGLGGARLINCPLPRRETYRAWLSIVGGLINVVGVDELLRHALRHLFGIEYGGGEGGGPRDVMHELVQAFGLTQ
ncbi:hypothetical protein [Vulcanisaeta sp. JCM 16161]|uniref:hypothetical protein n=1 Tax=Vulcanisaeta sp. JCM 16161 TaxID=1295372 RepID=UPI0006CFEB7F|nr:hypothetical protein [Vulcanisaeta sp. JCM 16161]